VLKTAVGARDKQTPASEKQLSAAEDDTAVFHFRRRAKHLSIEAFGSAARAGHTIKVNERLFRGSGKPTLNDRNWV